MEKTINDIRKQALEHRNARPQTDTELMQAYAAARTALDLIAIQCDLALNQQASAALEIPGFMQKGA